MSSDQPDVISSEPHPLPNRSAWAAVVLLAAAFVAALVVAVHYHNQSASLQHQLSLVQGRIPSAATVASSASGLPVTEARVVLLGSNSLTAQVTFAAASSPAGQAYLTISAQISGGRPHTRYTLLWGSCSFRSLQQSVTGVTDAYGRADLVGQVSQASIAGSYQLQLIPGNSDLQALTIYGYWSQPARGQAQTASFC